MSLFNQFKTPAYLHRSCPVLEDIHKRRKAPNTRFPYVFMSIVCVYPGTERLNVEKELHSITPWLQCTACTVVGLFAQCKTSQWFVLNGWCTLRGRAQEDLSDLPAAVIQQT